MKKSVFPLLALVMTSAAWSQAVPAPKVEGAWVRTSVAGQQATGAFMKITAPETMQLVGVSSPVAGVAQVHEMKMDGDVMTMRAISKLELPAGQTIELKPGGYHLMLLDLKQPLAVGSTVRLTLSFRTTTGTESRMELQVPVAARDPAGSAAAAKHGNKLQGHKH
jgi:periplasmic copper chaperone A